VLRVVVLADGARHEVLLPDPGRPEAPMDTPSTALNA
jgi:hypothetical protein